MENNNSIVLYDKMAVYENESVDIANALAQARQKTSLLESKIELLAIYKIRQDYSTVDKVDTEGNPYKVHAVSIANAEIKRLLNTNSGSMYAQLEFAANELTSKKIIYRNPGENEFSFKPLFENVEYKNGIFSIEFSPQTENLFLELNDKFTRLPLTICFSFSKNGGFQLYKLLKSLCWTLGNDIDSDKSQIEQKCKVVEFNLAELRMQLGYINLNQTPLRKEASKSHPNFEKMSREEKNPKYARWVDFKEKVLIPGMKEINEISDLYISEMQPISAAHNKTSGVRFIVHNNVEHYTKNRKKNVKEENRNVIDYSGQSSKIDEDDFIDSIRDLMQMPISTKEYKAIARAADYDYSLCEKVYHQYLDSAKRNDIMQPVGWIISAIREPHSEPIMTNIKTNSASFVNERGEKDPEYISNIIKEFGIIDER